jgi:hypothetical protein
VIGHDVIVVETNGRFDGSTEALPELVEGFAEVFATW